MLDQGRPTTALVDDVNEAREIVQRSILLDPLDGKKRVLITVGADGNFEPVAWFGLTHGLVEASNIAAHGALILTECVWQESVTAAEAEASRQSAARAASHGE
jgi:hypothetical protein